MVEYRPCGGCGAAKPEERCIGCLHSFFDGDWPEKYQGSMSGRMQTSNPATSNAPKRPAIYEEWGF